MFQRLITEVQQVKFQYFGKKGISNGLRLFTYPNSPKSPKCTFLNWESWGRQKAKWLFTYPNSPKFTFFNFILGVGKKPSGFLPTPSLPIEKSEFGRVGVGKKPLGFLPTPSLQIEKSEFGRVGVGKKPLGFLPTPTLPIKKREFGRLGRVGVGKKPEPILACLRLHSLITSPYWNLHFISEFDMRFSDYCFVMFRHKKKVNKIIQK